MMYVDVLMTQPGADLENSGGGVWPIPKRQNVDSLFNHKKSKCVHYSVVYIVEK